jgi:hypothetical protein
MLSKGLQPLKHIMPADYTEQTAILDHRQAVPSTVHKTFCHLTEIGACTDSLNIAAHKVGHAAANSIVI